MDYIMKTIKDLVKKTVTGLMLVGSLIGCKDISKTTFEDGTVEYENANSPTIYAQTFMDFNGDNKLDYAQNINGTRYLIFDSTNQVIDLPWYIDPDSTVLRDSEKGQEFEKEYEQIKSAYEAQENLK